MKKKFDDRSSKFFWRPESLCWEIIRPLQFWWWDFFIQWSEPTMDPFSAENLPHMLVMILETASVVNNIDTWSWYRANLRASMRKIPHRFAKLLNKTWILHWMDLFSGSFGQLNNCKMLKVTFSSYYTSLGFSNGLKVSKICQEKFFCAWEISKFLRV